MMIGDVIAMGGDASPQAAVVVDVYEDGTTARVVYERTDGTLLAGDPSRGWDLADDEEGALWRAAEPWNAH